MFQKDGREREDLKHNKGLKGRQRTFEGCKNLYIEKEELKRKIKLASH